MGGDGSGSIDAVLMKLDGTKIKEDGSEEESDFFNFLKLPAGDYSDIQLTAEQARDLRNFAIRMRFGTSAMIPLKCLGGEKCPIKSCPFSSENNWPIGRPCPLEMRFVQMKTASYVEDLKVDVESATEMSLVNRLVELDLMDFRANAGLSADEKAQTLLQKITSSNENFTSESLAVHPLVDIKDKHHKQRMQILESLTATRKEKYKRDAALKRRDGDDMASHMPRMRKLQKKLMSDHIKVKKADDESESS
jgi:hypothetical protein